MSAGHDKPNHPYHLVDPSPWPLVGAVSGGTTAIGMVFFMHAITPWLLVAGCLLILATMFVWWRDVINEAVHQGHHTQVGHTALHYGLITFLHSRVMCFPA